MCNRVHSAFDTLQSKTIPNFGEQRKNSYYGNVLSLFSRSAGNTCIVTDER
jgi:hypothetical protein